MKINLLYTLAVFLMLQTSCESLVEDINNDPNNISIDDIPASSFLTGALLATASFHCGHASRIAGMWSGQLVGYTAVHATLYNYNISSAELNDAWNLVYLGILPNVQHIQKTIPDDVLLVGISKTIEALAISTTASLFEHIPYTEINTDIEDPKFDDQIEVLTKTLKVLDEAITTLEKAESRVLPEDIYFKGNAEKWLATAHTIKARIYLLKRDYANAYNEALQGISNATNNMQFIPRGDKNVTRGDKNLFYELTFGPRSGEVGSRDSYMMQLLDSNSTVYRGNIKTDESARFGYYTIIENTGNSNLGFASQFEPQNIVTYQENQLILAEAGVRVQGFNIGLQHLNDYRVFLNEGGHVNANFKNLPHVYLPYESGDFEVNGLENSNQLTPSNALIKEIIEEKYLSTFGTFLPFDDSRRLRKLEILLNIPFPVNNNITIGHPERFPYPDVELNANINAPKLVPSIFKKTALNE